MNILIAYATRHGSTKRIAKLLAKNLSESPDIIDLKDFFNSDVSNYDLIILGSAVYFGKVQKHFREFIDGNIDTSK